MKVLVVDDNETNRKLLRLTLEAEGHEVLTASDGLEALERLEREPIDAIVSDILMPNMDGYRFCRAVRSRNDLRAIPFLFATSTYTSPSDEKFALELGADKFLRKPVPPAVLIAALREALARGGRPPAQPAAIMGETEVLAEYSQRLVTKLEEKNLQLAQRTSELEASEERFRLLVSSIKDYAIIMVDPEGRIVSWNSGAERITGYRAEEILGEHSSRFYPAEAQGQTEKELECARETGRCEVEGWRLRKDGSRFWANVAVASIRDESGRLRGFATVMRDMTERRQIEEQLRQAQKMESIGRLAGGVAHDFNNMLTVIQGYSELLLHRTSLDPEVAEALKEIHLAGHRSANLTRQLLAFSRKQNRHVTTVSLNEVIENVIKMLRRVIGEDIALETRFAPKVPSLQADPSMLDQVLLNLAVNARDAMPQGGRLVIGTEKVRLDDSTAQLHPGGRIGDFACLSVQDTGCGMSPEILANIFEPFFTTKEAGKGTGLGLATVFGIVQQHDGWIKVDSQPGSGSTFRIFLPCETSVDSVTETASASETMRGGPETILLVEDELVVRHLASKVLEGLGYNILEAGSGVEAMRLSAEHTGPLDLLLTDMVMPEGVTGRDLAERLLAQRPGLKVIYTSGYSLNVKGAELSLQEGVNFLQKPYSPSKLAHAVRECLDH